MVKWQAQGHYPGVYRDADDARHWRVVVNLGVAGGQRQRAVKVLHGRLADAREARAKLEHGRNTRQIRPQKQSAPRTVGAWMGHWLETYKRRRVERSTFARYQTYARLYIVPELGAKRLRDLSMDDMQAFYNALQDRGLHANTVQQAAALLRQALKTARVVGLLTHDPMAGAQGPIRPRRPKLEVPSEEQIRALLRDMAGADAAAYPITRFALASGLREGELIALEWPQLDLDKAVVHVRRSATRVPAEGEGGSYYVLEFKAPKTEQSVRDVPLDAATITWLRGYRHQILELKMQLRPQRWTDADGDLVFPCTSCFAGGLAGRAWQAGSLRKAFGRYAEKVGLGYMRFHDLRHTYASHLLKKGVPLKVVSEMLGHTRIMTTADVYGHVMDEQRRDAAEVLANLWGNPAQADAGLTNT